MSSHRPLQHVNAQSALQAALRFLRERMHGEGDTMRHLASVGYRLSYEQDPRTEFDFAVTNMSVDLRSGVRLLRAAELLTGGTLPPGHARLHAGTCRRDLRIMKLLLRPAEAIPGSYTTAEHRQMSTSRNALLVLRAGARESPRRL